MNDNDQAASRTQQLLDAVAAQARIHLRDVFDGSLAAIDEQTLATTFAAAVLTTGLDTEPDEELSRRLFAHYLANVRADAHD